MQRAFVFLALLISLCWAQSALAAEETTTLWCVNMPGCCTFNCVMIDVDTWCCCGNKAPLYVEFLDDQKNILGTATFANWVGYCETTAQTDKPVDSNSVCYVRLRKTVDDCCISWMSLRVLCDNCCKSKWRKVYKGCPGCWTPVPEVVPVPEPEAIVVPPPVEQPEEPVVAPEPRFPMPEETPAPEPETVVVEGRG